MREQHVDPDNDWNYVHNLMYAIANLMEEGRFKPATALSDKLRNARGRLQSTLYDYSTRVSISRIDPQLPVALRTADWPRSIGAQTGPRGWRRRCQAGTAESARGRHPAGESPACAVSPASWPRTVRVGCDSRIPGRSRVMRYFDASALVQRYVREANSVTVRRLLASGVVATSRLSEVEVSSGIVRRAREGAFTAPRRDRMLAAWQRDLPAVAIVEMIPEITTDAHALLGRHPLRAGDAIQLASCLYLQRQLAEPVPFVAFDRRLAAAAHDEGCHVIPRPDLPRKVAAAVRRPRRAPTRA